MSSQEKNRRGKRELFHKCIKKLCEPLKQYHPQSLYLFYLSIAIYYLLLFYLKCNNEIKEVLPLKQLKMNGDGVIRFFFATSVTMKKPMP